MPKSIELLGQAAEIGGHAVADAKRQLGIGGGDQAHRDCPHDERVHDVEKTRPGAASPGVGRLRFDHDRLHLGADRGHFLVALQLDQFQLGAVARLRVRNDLVEQLGNRPDDRFDNCH